MAPVFVAAGSAGRSQDDFRADVLAKNKKREGKLVALREGAEKREDTIMEDVQVEGDAEGQSKKESTKRSASEDDREIKRAKI